MPDGYGVSEPSVTIFMVMEAIGSVALSHDEDCDCTACRAADGDERAMDQIVADLTYAKAPFA